MRRARAEGNVPLAPEAALRLWADPDRWAGFVEGFARVVEGDAGWPAVGSRVVWESVPAGRGRVTEEVAEHAPDRLATVVSEDRLTGRQLFRAAESEAGARVELSMDYTLTRSGPFGWLADVIFIRRAIRDALRRTVARFAVEAEEEAGLR